MRKVVARKCFEGKNQSVSILLSEKKKKSVRGVGLKQIGLCGGGGQSRSGIRRRGRRRNTANGHAAIGEGLGTRGYILQRGKGGRFRRKT